MGTDKIDEYRRDARAAMVQIHKDNAWARRERQGRFSEATPDELRIGVEEQERAARLIAGVSAGVLEELEDAVAAYRGDATLNADWLASDVERILTRARGDLA